jgi:multiple sugar transport system substrate-binding protein
VKRLCLALVILTAAIWLGGGCTKVTETPATGPQAGSAPVAGGGTELVLFTWTARDEEQVNLELIKQFEAANPGVTVRLQNETGGSQTAMQKLQTMLSAQQGPDVISIHGAFFIPLAAKGALLDLGQFTSDAEFKVADFSSDMVDLCKYEGKLYSLPRYTSVYSMFYNKTLFDEAKVAYPGKEGAWDWAAFRKTAKALTKDSDGDGKVDQWGCVLDFWGARIYPWLWQNDASLMNEDRSRCVLDSPEAIAALQYLYDLRFKDKVAAAASNSDHNAALTAFAAGHVGMYMTGPWDIQTLKQSANLQWDVAPLPQGKQQATMLGTENYGLWAGTKHPQEAWKLFKFLMSPEVQAQVAEKLEKMPSRTSVLQGAYSQGQPGFNRKVFVDAVAYGRQPENIPEWSQVKDLIQNQLDLIWVQKATVSTGLKKAAADVNKTLKELRAKK